MALEIAQNNRNWRDEVQPRGLPTDLVKVFVLFVNTTNRTLDLYWVCDQDTENKYMSLKPKEQVPVNTYNTHSWFFRDYYTGERMHVRSKRLFCPIRIRVPNPQQPDQLRDVRSPVLIHFPLRSLKENSLWLIIKMLIRHGDSPREAINRYMIPETLKQNMLLILNSIEAYRRPSIIGRR